MPDKQFTGYFFVFENESKKTRTFGFGTDKEKILERKNEEFQNKQSIEKILESEESPTSPILSHLIDRALRLGMKQSHLISMASFSREKRLTTSVM